MERTRNETNMTTRTATVTMVLAAMFLALGIVMPFITGQIPEVGSMLLPMHLPVLICGFVCGWKYGLAVGFIVPLLRSVLFGMPPLMPTGTCMAFELAAYGACTGLLYQILPKKNISVYVSLVGAMAIGRVVWGVVSMAVYGMMGNAFSMQMFLAGAFLNAVPGMILQIVLIPIIIMALRRARVMK